MLDRGAATPVSDSIGDEIVSVRLTYWRKSLDDDDRVTFEGSPTGHVRSQGDASHQGDGGSDADTDRVLVEGDVGGGRIQGVPAITR